MQKDHKKENSKRSDFFWFSGCVQQILTRITHIHTQTLTHACPQNSSVLTAEDLVVQCHINDPRGHFSLTPLPISHDTPLLCEEKSISRIKPSVFGQGKSVTIISPTTCRDKAVRPRPSSSRSMCPRVNAMLVICIFGFRDFVLFHLWSRRDSIRLTKIAEETTFNWQLKSLLDAAGNQHLSLTHGPSLSNILTNKESINFFPLGFCQRSVPSVHNYQAVFWHSQSLSTRKREAIKTRSRSCITRPCATQSMLTMPFSTVVILLIDTQLNAFCNLMESSASYTLKKSLHLVAKGFINLPAWCWRASITP